MSVIRIFLLQFVERNSFQNLFDLYDVLFAGHNKALVIIVT